MKMTAIGTMAKKLGIEPAGMKKAQLVRSIQKAEGNTECYGHFVDACPHMDCCFRSDCKKEL